MRKKPIATLSLDLDNQWSYMKTHGDFGWDSFPSYFDLVVPRTIETLKKKNLRITFMIVGQDAALGRNRMTLQSIASEGHEIGNHSFHHEPWLHLYSKDKIRSEIQTAEDAIQEATGVRTRGFRGPGFSLSKDVLEVLSENEYSYDASTFPTFIGPLARMFYFRTAKLAKQERQQRKQLFGAFAEGFRPIKPYRWNLSSEDLLEIPVTTMPLFRTPIHFSYLLYLAGLSPLLSRLYFSFSLTLCRIAEVPPSLLLHPLDFLGRDDVDELDFFPAMGQTSEWKIRQLNGYLDQLKAGFEVLPLESFVKRVDEESSLPEYEPRFRRGSSPAHCDH